MTRSPAEKVHLPIYEDLVRERGDVVAEAQIAAAHTQNQAVALLGSEEVNAWEAPSGVPRGPTGSTGQFHPHFG